MTCNAQVAINKGLSIYLVLQLLLRFERRRSVVMSCNVDAAALHMSLSWQLC